MMKAKDVDAGVGAGVFVGADVGVFVGADVGVFVGADVGADVGEFAGADAGADTSTVNCSIIKTANELEIKPVDKPKIESANELEIKIIAEPKIKNTNKSGVEHVNNSGVKRLSMLTITKANESLLKRVQLPAIKREKKQLPARRCEKQLQFASNHFKKPSREYGGALINNRRKGSRPLSSKHALHLVLKINTNASASVVTENLSRLSVSQQNLKSTPMSAEKRSLKKHKNGIAKLLKLYSQKFGIKIYKYAIAGNHIHIILFSGHRVQYRAWIRSLTGQLSLRFKIKWGHRPWSRVLSWGKEFFIVTKYVLQNTLEADGLIAYKPRTRTSSNQFKSCNV